MTRSLVRLMAAGGIVLALTVSVGPTNPLVSHAIAAPLADDSGNWIYLGLVAETTGSPSQWRTNQGLCFPAAPANPNASSRLATGFN
jgi:hypothetical protein